MSSQTIMALFNNKYLNIYNGKKQWRSIEKLTKNQQPISNEKRLTTLAALYFKHGGAEKWAMKMVMVAIMKPAGVINNNMVKYGHLMKISDNNMAYM